MKNTFNRFQKFLSGNIRKLFTVTLGDKIQAAGGVTSGFDYMRLVLSVAVLYGHSFMISGDSIVTHAEWLNRVRGYIVLPMFFSLSGFLVAASLLRTHSILAFLGLRGLRILPALFVEITLSALILGPLLTSFGVGAYFADHDFSVYFFNIVGYIHYHLPGVFLHNPVPRTVNGSLWTVPYEAECYVVLVALSLLGIRKHPTVFFGLLVVLTLALLGYGLLEGDPDPARGTATGRQLILFFVSGVLLYLLRHLIPWSAAVAAAAAFVSATCVTSHVYIYLTPLPVAYLTAYLGLTQPRKLPVLFTGDYSYGIYLYAFPIQQAIFQWVPAATRWYVDFALALAVTGCFAALSWHAVERPSLRLKRYFLTQKDRGRPETGEMISPERAAAVS